MKRKRQPVFFKLGESKHDPADDQWEHSYTVYYDDDVVHQVEVSFPHSPGDIHVGEVAIPRPR